MLKKFFRDETGLELSEYAVAAALIALATVAAFGGLKGLALNGADGREGHELLVAPRRGEARRHTLLDIRGL